MYECTMDERTIETVVYQIVNTSSKQLSVYKLYMICTMYECTMDERTIETTMYLIVNTSPKQLSVQQIVYDCTTVRMYNGRDKPFMKQPCTR